MRALVYACGGSAMSALTENRSAAMLPLIDRPVLQHVLEYIVDLGVHSFDFVLSDRPDEIERYFGDGKRWGCTIRYHLVRDSAAAYRAAQTLPQSDECVLVAHADRLPLLPAGALTDSAACVYSGGEWCGWAVAPGSVLPQLASAGAEAEAEAILRAAAPARVESALTLSFRDYPAYLEAHRAVLEQRFPMLLLTGRQAADGIWLSRNVAIHPTARLTAPVFIGENCRIGEDVQLGPHAVVGADSALDRQSTVRNSLVLPGSYVGEALDLENSIVEQGRLVNVDLGAEIAIGDEFLLGSLAGRKSVARWPRLIGQAFAVALLLVLWPIILLTAVALAAVRRGVPFPREEFVHLPAPSDPDRWRVSSYRSGAPANAVRTAWGHLLLRFLPALPAVAVGRLALVGVEPRSGDAIQALPPDWRALYLKSKVGLLTETFVEYGADASADDRYACEAFYSVSRGVRLDCSILARYAQRLFWFRSRRKGRSAAAGASR